MWSNFWLKSKVETFHDHAIDGNLKLLKFMNKQKIGVSTNYSRGRFVDAPLSINGLNEPFNLRPKALKKEEIVKFLYSFAIYKNVHLDLFLEVLALCNIFLQE